VPENKKSVGAKCKMSIHNSLSDVNGCSAVLLRADIPPVAVLVALHCPASATEFVSATREIFIGCVKSTPGFVRKVSSQLAVT